MSSINTETETVIKRVLPYLKRRGYSPETDFDFETPVKLTTRYAKGYVDILVTCGKAKPRFLIEAKRASKKLNAVDRDQALDYSRSLPVPFCVVTNGEDFQCFNTSTGKAIRWDGKISAKVPRRDQLDLVLASLKSDKALSDIPLSKDASLPFRPSLPLKQLNALFAHCHNAIRKIEKNEEHAFSDFSKLLFLKLLEEKADTSDFPLPYSYRFFELAERPDDEADQVKDAIEQMKKAIQKKTAYGDVLDDPIYLKQPRTFQKIVRALSAVSFHDSGLDSKGAAFEYFVRATLKGKRLGQYFTPRPLVEIMSCLVGRDMILNSLASSTPVRVADPACGTGGFLVFLMKDALGQLDQRLASKKLSKAAFDKIAAQIKQHTFFGSDANEGVACAAKMNMIVAGDGHTNICAEDSLARSSKVWSVDSPTCDLILSNPPFGTSESDTLSADDLAQYPVRTTKGQLLFLQKMVLATKPDGFVCTVIDEGVLNTESAKELRRWLFEKTEVLAVMRLPEETFKPNKINVRSSVLLLRRRQVDDDQLEEDYPVTFIDLRSLGYEGSGERIRGFAFDKLVGDASNIMLDYSLGTPRSGEHWFAQELRAKEIVSDASCRLDYKYWDIELRAKIADARKRGVPSIEALNTIVTARGKSPKADLYVDEADGFALVVKAGSSISQFGELVREDADYIEKQVFDEAPDKHKLRRNDVLLASTGDGTLGKCCVFDLDSPAVADGHVTVIRVDPKKVDPYYLCDYLRVGFGAAQIDRLYSGSTGLIELTPEHVAQILVELPGDPKMQRTISDNVRAEEGGYQNDLRSAATRLGNARDVFRFAARVKFEYPVTG